jgi:hypothetical protein
MTLLSELEGNRIADGEYAIPGVPSSQMEWVSLVQ